MEKGRGKERNKRNKNLRKNKRIKNKLFYEL